MGPGESFQGREESRAKALRQPCACRVPAEHRPGPSSRAAGRSRRALRAVGRALPFALGQMGSHLQGHEQRSNTIGLRFEENYSVENRLFGATIANPREVCCAHDVHGLKQCAL